MPLIDHTQPFTIPGNIPTHGYLRVIEVSRKNKFVTMCVVMRISHLKLERIQKQTFVHVFRAYRLVKVVVTLEQALFDVFELLGQEEGMGF